MRKSSIALVTLLTLMGCGGGEPLLSSIRPLDAFVLDVTLNLTKGDNCNVGGQAADVSVTAGAVMVITAAGSSSMTPQFVLYAPDYATQLAGSSPSGAGKATLAFATREAGVHHLSVCDANGVAGSLRLTVAQQAVR